MVNADGDPVCLVQGWECAHLMGELQVEFNADGVVTSCAEHPRVPFDGGTLTYTCTEGQETSERVLEGDDAAAVIAALMTRPEYVAVERDAATTAALAAGG